MFKVRSRNVSVNTFGLMKEKSIKNRKKGNEVEITLYLLFIFNVFKYYTKTIYIYKTLLVLVQL